MLPAHAAGRRPRCVTAVRTVTISVSGLWALGQRQRRITILRGREPDFVLLLEFSTGAPVVISGEMKWDWRINPGDQGSPCGYDSQDLGGCAPCGIEACALVYRYTSTTVGKPRVGLPREGRADRFRGLGDANFAHVTTERPIFWKQASSMSCPTNAKWSRSRQDRSVSAGAELPLP